MTAQIFRHVLPTKPGRFTIGAHGFKPLTLRVEKDVPVIDEMGIALPEGDKPYPHHFVWVETGEGLPDGASTASYVGTVDVLGGLILHLFQVWI